MDHSARQRFNKEELFVLGLKGWEECGYTDGVGRRGHFRQSVGEAKRGDGAGTQYWRTATKRGRKVKGAAGNRLENQGGSCEVKESHSGESPGSQ